MSLLDAVRLALTQIRVQKLKSFFTLLGVTIGVMFLIAVVSIVNGMSKYVEEDFAAKFLGVNTFTLRRFPNFQNGNVTEATWREWQRRPQITSEDAEAVRAALPTGTHWAIQDSRYATPSSSYRNSGPQARVSAVSADYFLIKNLDLERGRVFTEQEEQIGAPVIVLGSETAETYFPNVDPLGKDLRLEGLPFRVIGVLKKQGSTFGISLDRQAIGPFHSDLRRVTHARMGLDGVLVQGSDVGNLQDAQESTREVMRRRHHLRPSDPDNFMMETSDSALGAWQTIKQFLVIGGIVLPLIGLVVGAIVIMNIMLVAVADRTREIGIRKALGARRRDIMWQFLVESATLSVFGAILGIALGFGLSLLIKSVTPLPSSVALWSVIVSVVLGAGVGIIAGIYPASRASRLDPILALRSE
ncbi:MAG: ABC transporter permease [Gemmatimonadaceae bacterium]